MAKKGGESPCIGRRGRRARRLGLIERLEWRYCLASLSPGAILSPVPVEPDPQGGVVIAMQTQQFASQEYSGFLSSSVIQGDSSNPLGGLTFTYQLANNATSANALERLTVVSFANFPTDVSRRSSGAPPALADRPAPELVGFSFQDGPATGRLLPGAQSSLLVIQTGAQTFSVSSATVIGGMTSQVQTFAPQSSNRPPVITTNTGSTVAEGGTDVITSSELTTTDPDTPPQALVYTAQTPPASGAVLLNGVPTDSITQADINAGRVTYVHNGSETTSDSLMFRVSDGTTSISGTFNVTVTPVNDPPSAKDDVATVPEDSTNNVISVLNNDADVDGDALSVSKVTQPANGTVSIVLGGAGVQYTPNSNFFGVDSFTYTANDGNGGSDTAKVTVTVTNVNDPPSAVNDSATVAAGSTNNFIPVLSNDTDIDGDKLSVSMVTAPANGMVSIVQGTADMGGGVRYTPNPNFSGADSFTYTASDGRGGSDTATVTITVTSANRSPIAVDDTFTTLQNKALSANVLFNDSDPDNDPLVATLQSAPANGNVVLQSNGSFTYTPNTGFVGTDTFQYLLSDGKGGTDIGQVTIAVTVPANRPPIAVNDAASTALGTKVQINVLANDTDPDPNDVLTVIAVGAAANGQASIGAGGVVSYQPNPTFVGNDSFTYTISDGRGGTGAATVTVTVTARLGANNDTFEVNEDSIRNPLDVLANDVDPQGDTFKVTAITQGAKGVVEIGPNGANVLYTPDPNFAGADTFTYTITDSTGSMDTATVTVTVADLGESPIAVDDKATVIEDGPPAVINVLANDSDPDGGTLKITAVTQGKNGTVAIRATQLDLVYQPNPNFQGADTFTYTITDNNGNQDTATVTVTVTGVPDAPEAKNDVASVKRGTSSIVVDVLANDVDLDGDPLTITSATTPAGGTATIAPDGKSIRYTPNAGFSGSDLFQYTITDPSGLTDSATVLVEVNLNRVDAKDDVFTTPIGVPVLFGSRGVLANDVDPEGDALVRAEVLVGPANGTVVMNADGSFTYTSKAGFIGADSFTYAAFDALGASDAASVTINVRDAPPAPKNNAFSVQEGSSQNFINVLANDTDPEGDKLRIVAVTQPRNGKVTIVADGLIYEPNPGFVGTDEFTYTVSDDEGEINIASTQVALVTVFVHSSTLPYFPMPDEFTRPEDTVVTLLEADLIGNDYNPTAQPLIVASVSNAMGGTAVLNPDKSVTFTASPNFVGFASFNYKCAPPFSASTGTVTIDFTAVQDLPSAAADTATVNEDSPANVIDVLGNDLDVDGDTLIITAVTQGAQGSVAIGAGGLNVLYTPQANFTGIDSFTYTISDGNGGAAIGAAAVTVINIDSDFIGTISDDVFLVRRDAPGTNVEVFSNDTAAGAPIFSALLGSVSSLLFDAQAGDDRLIVDFVNGNPIPTGGIDFLAGGNTASGDQLIVRNGGATAGSAAASSTSPGEGTLTLGASSIRYTGVEPINVSGFSSFTAVTPNANDTLAVTQPASNITQISGSSGAVALSPITFSNTGMFIIDAATNDGPAGNDALTITASGAVPDGANFVEYRSGTGANSLQVQSGSARVDATVAAGATLDTTLAANAALVTHRFRQTSLALGNGSRATVLAAGTADAVSRLNALTIGTGATLDINDNAVVLDYTGDSPATTIRARIIEGRGGVGIGNGNWNGTGITSGAAAAANGLNPESRSIGYADNALLPLGPYSTFRGQPVDSTAVLIAFTRTGDANLDSLVSDDDATILGALYPSASAGWAMADFDYGDTVDDNDATLLGAFYDPGAAPFAAPATRAITNDSLARDVFFAEMGEEAGVSLSRRLRPRIYAAGLKL